MKVTFLNYSKYNKIWIWSFSLPSPIRSLVLTDVCSPSKLGTDLLFLDCLFLLQRALLGGHILTTHCSYCSGQASVMPSWQAWCEGPSPRISEVSLVFFLPSIICFAGDVRKPQRSIWKNLVLIYFYMCTWPFFQTFPNFLTRFSPILQNIPRRLSSIFF